MNDTQCGIRVLNSDWRNVVEKYLLPWKIWVERVVKKNSAKWYVQSDSTFYFKISVFRTEIGKNMNQEF